MTRLAYITSPSFSGSTLLTFLLAEHPDIATVGELKGQALGDVDDYNCSCGTPIRHCPFWNKLIEELHNSGVEFRLEEFGTHFRCRHRAMLDRIVRARVRGPILEALRRIALACLWGGRGFVQDRLDRNAAIINAIMSLTEAKVFLDGSKDPVRAKYFIDSKRFDVFAICLIRDGRGTSCSYMKHHHMNMQDSATEWLRTQLECERLLAQLPSNRRLVVKYEQLCQDPSGTVNDIFGFLEIDARPLVQSFRTANQHIVGNAMRLESSSEIRLDEKWRDTLTLEDLNTFNRIAGAMNHRLGYPVETVDRAYPARL